MIIKQDCSGNYLAIKLIPETSKDQEELRKLCRAIEPQFQGKITTDFHSVKKSEVLSTNIILNE